MHSTTGRALVLTAVAGWLIGCATAPASRADKEALLAEAASTLRRMRAEYPGVDLIVQHYSYALFPTVTKGGLVVGGARGQGVVYERGQHVGYCDLTQGSVGAQAGAQTFSELLVLRSARSVSAAILALDVVLQQSALASTVQQQGHEFAPIYRDPSQAPPVRLQG
jgi:lipid-binding SYLF domain-containing protein